MAEICRRILDVLGMPVELDVSVVVPFFEGRVISGTALTIKP